jgi:hypothetical protein
LFDENRDSILPIQGVTQQQWLADKRIICTAFEAHIRRSHHISQSAILTFSALEWRIGARTGCESRELFGEVSLILPVIPAGRKNQDCGAS